MTITNTGTDILVFQPYTYSTYFVTSIGNIINPPYPAPITGYPSPINPSPAQSWVLANFGTYTLSTYLSHLDGSQSTNWLMDFSYTNGPALPTTLAPGAEFTYNLYVGLGSNAPYGIPGCYFSVNIPLAAICVTPTPTPTSCPTPTLKPTSTPCPTCTPKPTPTATPKPTSCPTPTPKPTSTPCPTCTPKPTSCPTPHAWRLLNQLYVQHLHQNQRLTATPKPTSCPTPTPKPTPTNLPPKANLMPNSHT